MPTALSAHRFLPLALIVVCAVGCVVPVGAQTVQAGHVWYQLDTTSGTATVVRPGGNHSHEWETYSGSVHVPAHVRHEGRTYRVTDVGESAFAFAYRLRRVWLPSTVTCLQRDAFAGSQSLRYVRLPRGLMRIEDRAFFACHSLRRLHLPSSVTYIGEDVFYQ